MKHAGDEALDRIADLLVELRREEGIKERKRGVFYVKSSALLHFHEDPAGLFADLRTATGWDRLPVTTKTQRRALVSRFRSVLKQVST